jgi:Carboxypeptidase regulatory-like domain/TonB-dependent Receptor Plug Domain/TonB dependent receptor
MRTIRLTNGCPLKGGTMGARPALLAVLVFALLFARSGPVFSQITGAQLNGSVRDESGGAVKNATLALLDSATNAVYRTTSNDSGFYVIPNLPPGHYDLTVTYPGFATTVHKGIELTVGQSATVDISLKVATQSEHVVVTTEVPPIEPTKTEISQVIGTQQIEDLPISNRQFTDFALLTPGVSSSRTSLGSTFTEYEATQISFGGMRSFNNQITVDGAEFVNVLTGVQRSTPPQESVQEFRVVNNSFGAEYGRALGGIVNIVTKSGGNDFHGSAYDYLQNNATDARSLLQPAPLPDVLRQNQFGGTLGGPIRKDKTFFFVNYEGKRRGESPTYAPDLVNNITVIDQAKAYLGLAPEGNVPGFAGLTSTLKTANNDYGFAKLDNQFNPSNHLSVLYNIEDGRDLNELVGQTLDGGGIGTPSGGRNLFVRDQSLVGTLATTIKPNLVNNFLMQWARRHYNFPGATGQPDLSVVNDLEFGHNFGTYDATYESRFQVGDSVAWVKGNHVAKFGFDGNYVWDHNNYPGFEPERILFPNLDCMYTFANTVEGFTSGTYGTIPVPANGCPLDAPADGVSFLYWGVSLPRTGFANGYVPPAATGAGFNGGWPSAFPTNMYSNFAFNLNHGYWGVFAQDQWRLTPKFTINYGLRWDFESGLGNFINPDYRAFQPRIGFAYSPDSRTVIRSGFGIFTDRNNMTFFFTTGNQKTIPGYFCNPPSADPNCTAATPTVVIPMIQKGAANGGWQLSAQPGYPGTPAIPCGPPCAGLPGGTISLAALTATSILLGAPYDAVSLTGPCTLTAQGPAGACGVGSGGIQRTGRLPYSEQASLEIDRTIGRGLTLNVGYLFVAAHKLVRGNNINVPCVAGASKPQNPSDAQGLVNPDGSLTDCTGAPVIGPLGLGPFFSSLANPAGLEFGVPSAASPAPTLSAGLLDYNNNVANAAYNGLTVTAIERAGQYFNLTANYTYSHTIDNGNFTTFINLPQNQFNYAAERASSNQDARQRFVANFTASTPSQSFLRNFQFSSIITLQSGRPFTLFAGNNTFGDVAGGSTDRVGGPPVPVAAGCAVSAALCTTTVGRNTYIGDPLYDWDGRISRFFQIREHLRLDLMVDVFNFLNRANVDEITSVYGSPVFCGTTPVVPRRYNDSATRAIQQGLVSCASQTAATVGPAPLNFPGGAFIADGLLPVSIPDAPNPVFGLPRTVFNPRQFQFAAKFSF